jgi:hypothetical protein
MSNPGNLKTKMESNAETELEEGDDDSILVLHLIE